MWSAPSRHSTTALRCSAGTWLYSSWVCSLPTATLEALPPSTEQPCKSAARFCQGAVAVSRLSGHHTYVSTNKPSPALQTSAMS